MGNLGANVKYLQVMSFHLQNTNISVIQKTLGNIISIELKNFDLLFLTSKIESNNLCQVTSR